jgi:hypothetical protein
MPAYPSASGPGGDCNCQHGNQGSSGPFNRVRGWFRSGNDQCAERPGLVNRMREWFGRDSQANGNGHNGYPGNGYPGNGHQGAYNQPNPNGFANPNSFGSPNSIQQTAPAQGGQGGMVQTQNGPYLGGNVQSVSRPSSDNLGETREPELARPPVVKQAPARQAPTVKQAPATNQVRPASSVRSGPVLQAPPARAESKINPRFVNNIGHADDYSWITGQLDREGNRWVIRYATPDTVDRYQGQVTLAPGIDLNHLRPGELVSANGQITGTSNGAATFRATAVNKIKLVDEN